METAGATQFTNGQVAELLQVVSDYTGLIVLCVLGVVISVAIFIRLFRGVLGAS